MNDTTGEQRAVTGTAVFVTRNWYVAAWSSELRNRPLGRMLCGRWIVLFRDSAGRPQGVDGTCPHRGADLARGEVCGDTLACPFHGIAFDGAGRCARIPSQSPTAPIPKRLRLGSYPVVERAGLVWIWPEPIGSPAGTPDVPPPEPEFLEPSPGSRRQQADASLCTGSYLNSLENALDDAHLGFIHLRTLPGAPTEVAPYRLSVAADGRGYGGDVEFEALKPPCSITVNHPSGVASGHKLLDWLSRFSVNRLVTLRRAFHYQLCGSVCYTVDYAGGKRDQTFAFFTPGDAQRTWVFPGFIRNHSLNFFADRMFQRFLPALIKEDSAAMALLMPVASGPGGLQRPFVVRGDRQSFPFRRIYGDALRRENKPVPWTMEAGPETGAAPPS